VRIQKGFYYSGRIQADTVRGLDMIEKAMGANEGSENQRREGSTP
jgi:hypothetical protein